MTPMLCGIIGYPLGQTMSPALHNWAFGQLGIDANYQAWPTPPDALASFVSRVRSQGIHGVSVTIPHKESIISLLDELTPEARSVGAVNTLFWREGRLLGHNSDVDGFTLPLCAMAWPEARVLGAGGAARAAIVGLRSLGCGQIRVAARHRAKAEALAAELGCQVLDWEERDAAGNDGGVLVVNTTPLGMTGKDPAATALDRNAFCRIGGRGRSLAYDLVYNPLRTLFLREAEAAGWREQDGLDMFLGQALSQFRLWTGQEFATAAGRELLLRQLGGE